MLRIILSAFLIANSLAFCDHWFAKRDVNNLLIYFASLFNCRLQSMRHPRASGAPFSALAGLGVDSCFASCHVIFDLYPALLPPSAMDTIEQNLIPIFPPTIIIHHIRHGQGGEATRRLLGIKPRVVGLSIHFSASADAVESIALATSKEVYLLKLKIGDSSMAPSSTLDLLSFSDEFTLVAFDMAQVALHIHRSTQGHVRGVDLSTLFSPTKKPWQPSKFVTRKLSYDARKFDIDQLWEGGPECSFREVCLRAWLSAR